MSFNIRYYPNEDVWYIKDGCVYGDRVLSVQIFESGVYYTLNNRTGPFRNEELFESKALAEEEMEKVLADRIAVLSNKQTRAPHVREKLDALIKKLEEEKEAWPPDKGEERDPGNH